MSEGRYILIVDDEKEICLLLSSIVKAEGFETRIATSAQDAEAILASGDSPGIIFLDVHLDDEDGLDLIPIIKQRFPASEIIVISAYDSNEDIMDAYAEGADLFLSKPFTQKEIIEALEEVNNQI